MRTPSRLLAAIALALPAAAWAGACFHLGSPVVCPINPSTGLPLPDGSSTLFISSPFTCWQIAGGGSIFILGTTYTPFVATPPPPPVIGPALPTQARDVLALTAMPLDAMRAGTMIGGGNATTLLASTAQRLDNDAFYVTTDGAGGVVSGEPRDNLLDIIAINQGSGNVSTNVASGSRPSYGDGVNPTGLEVQSSAAENPPGGPFTGITSATVLSLEPSGSSAAETREFLAMDLQPLDLYGASSGFGGPPELDAQAEYAQDMLIWRAGRDDAVTSAASSHQVFRPYIEPGTNAPPGSAEYRDYQERLAKWEQEVARDVAKVEAEWDALRPEPPRGAELDTRTRLAGGEDTPGGSVKAVTASNGALDSVEFAVVPTAPDPQAPVSLIVKEKRSGAFDLELLGVKMNEDTAALVGVGGVAVVTGGVVGGVAAADASDKAEDHRDAVRATAITSEEIERREAAKREAGSPQVVQVTVPPAIVAPLTQAPADPAAAAKVREAAAKSEASNNMKQIAFGLASTDPAAQEKAKEAFSAAPAGAKAQVSQALRQSHLSAAQTAGDAALYVATANMDPNSGQTQEYRGEVVRDINESKKRPLLGGGSRLGEPVRIGQ